MPAPVIIGAAAFSGSLLVYASLRQCLTHPDFDQEQPVPLVSLNGDQPRLHTSMSTRPQTLSGKGLPSIAVTSPRDSVELDALSSSGESRTPDIPWEVDYGTVSEWANQAEGEFDEILRRFENYNGSATGQVRGQHLVVPPSGISAIRSRSSPRDERPMMPDPLGALSPANFTSPKPHSPPSLFRP